MVRLKIINTTDGEHVAHNSRMLQELFIMLIKNSYLSEVNTFATLRNLKYVGIGSKCKLC